MASDRPSSPRSSDDLIPPDFEVPENSEQERSIAAHKLKLLLNPSFNKFAIRFYNIGEYRKMFEENQFQGKEVSLYGLLQWKKPLGENFQDFLKKSAAEGWGNIALKMTGWPVSSLQAQFHRDFSRIYRRVTAETLQRSPEEVMMELRNRLDRYISDFHAQNPYLDYVRTLPDSLDFLDDDEKVTQMLLQLKDVPGGGVGSAAHDAPYHVAVIFHPSALETIHGSTAARESNGTIWYPFKRNNSQDGNLLLGSVNLFDDEHLTEELKKYASTSKDWSHPLFDVHGNIVFPT